MKFLNLFILIFCISSALSAQDSLQIAPPAVKKDTTYWRRNFQAGFNINQAAFTQNWKGGGANAIAISIFTNGTANYKRGKFDFASTIDLIYGINRTEAQGERKTADRIFLDGKAAYRMNRKWLMFGSLNFQSQFADGFRYVKDAQGVEQAVLISRFMAPGYITQSIGIEFKPVNYFFVRFGTGTLRQTIVTDRQLFLNEPKNYGVPIGKRVRNEVAFQIMSQFEKDIFENINLNARYLMFVAYDKINIKDTDHRLDMTFTAKVNKFLQVGLTGTLLYDTDMDLAVQYAQGMTIGLVYKF